jgi:Mg-chelatase subunit ChlD
MSINKRFTQTLCISLLVLSSCGVKPKPPLPMSSGASVGEPPLSVSPAFSPMDTSAVDILPLPPPSPPFSDGNNIPVSGTLTAGDIDDNLNFAAFQRYLNRQKDQTLPFVEMSDRVALHIVDNAGKNLSNARVRISSSMVPQIDRYAGTDGRFYLFPKFDNVTNSQINLQLAPSEDELGSHNFVFNTTLDLGELPENRHLTITMPEIAATLPHSLEIMFVIDTTGSMSDELRYLTTELRDIINAVQARHQQIRMRFGLVVYRDKGDAYIVRDFAFTESLNDMQIQLSQQKANDGGDYPEAMEQALKTAVNAKWSEGNVARLLFLVADAPPHDENLKAMLEQVRVARQKGIRIYPLAASGVADKAEFMMRQAEVLTQGRYLFLTDDSGVGSSHQEPSVPCYIVTHLNKLIARVIDSELAGQRIEPDDNEILRTVGHYDTGICTDNNVTPPKPSTP